MKTILVVGGAGYIGAHQVRFLLDKGFHAVVFDNLNTGHRELVDSRAAFFQGDLLSLTDLRKVFSSFSIDAVMHFAGFIQAGESVQHPLKYYSNNLIGAVNLLQVMNEFDVKKIIFSSSAAVYGEPPSIPITEDMELRQTTPYGRTKLMIEQMLKDCDSAYGLKYVSLRYFNAAGAAYGIGEWHEPESHLIPAVLSAVLARRSIKIFGTDYPTDDGTCIRDYVHVLDLIQAHYLALEFLFKQNKSRIYNLGSGTGYSVKQIISACKELTGADIPIEVCPRRQGDPAQLVASSEKIASELGWSAKLGLKEIATSAWEWHRLLANKLRRK